MTRLAAARRSDTAPAEVSVGIAAEDRDSRRRIAALLVGRVEFSIQHDAQPRALLSGGRACDILVFHCETIAAQELSLLSGLKREFGSLLMVVVCASANERNARRAVDSGVDGIAFDEQLEVALEPTLAAVLAGQTVVPRELRTAVRRPPLSFREKQILGMVVMGFTNNEIGARLFLAESTVKCHLSSAFSKLGVRSRNEAAAMILDPNGSLGTGILAITQADGDARGR